MLEAYKISVAISLTNHVSQGLLAVGGDLSKTDAQLAVFQKRLNSIKNDALKGGLLFGAGLGMLSLLKAPLAQVTQWEKIMASMKQKGLGDAQIADARKFIMANDIYGVSMMERAKIFNEAQGSFRESGMGGSTALEAAKTMTPVLAAYKLAMSSLGGKGHDAAEGSFVQLNKIVELMGGLGDTKRASEIVGGVFKAVQGSGKMISERDIRQFITMGGSAVSMLPARMIFGALEPQMGEFGGSAMGTGFNTAYRLLTGTQSKPSKLFVREALNMGLWDSSKLVFNSQGGVKQYKGQPFDPAMSNLMRTDTPEFAKRLMGIYASKGITSQPDRERENDILLGRTGAKIYNKVMLQLSVMEHSLKAYDQAQTPDQVNGVQKKSIMQQSAELHAKLNDLQLNLGLVILPMAITALEKLLPMVKSLAAWMSQNHTAVKLLAEAFVALAVGLMVRGSVLLLSAAIKGLGIASLAAGSEVTKAGKLMNAAGSFFVGWQIGSWLHDVVTEGTKFDAWLGSMIAHLMAPFSSDAREAIKGNGGVQVPSLLKTMAKILPVAPLRIASMIAGGDAVPPATGKPVEVHTTVNLDGEKVAKNTTLHQTRSSSAPMPGTGRFDPTRAPLSPGMNAR